MIFNANRSKDSRPVSPFDFVAGLADEPEDKEKEELRRSIKHAIGLAFMNMKRPDGTRMDRAEVLEEKRKMVERMTAKGVEDPESLIREVYPDL